MAAIPEPNHATVAAIYRAYEAARDEEHRPHLGASLIGGPCERALWLTFRWAGRPQFDGRMLRLFETGNLAEARFVANLRAIGAQVHDQAPDGEQWRVTAVGGHFGGHLDAAIVGLPEAPKAWHVGEFKTHSSKSFKGLLQHGVQKSKPQHYAQMTVYMGLTGIERALYLAVNKDTDELYSERLEFDAAEYARLLARATRVITAAEPPLRVSNDPAWHVCKRCTFHAQCHGSEVAEVNCRTCAHSTPRVDEEGGKWVCEKQGGSAIPLGAQREVHGCHRYIPILLECSGRQVKYVNDDVVYESKAGQWANGTGPGALTSPDIYALADKGMAPIAAALKRGLAMQDIDSRVVA